MASSPGLRCVPPLFTNCFRGPATDAVSKPLRANFSLTTSALRAAACLDNARSFSFTMALSLAGDLSFACDLSFAWDLSFACDFSWEILLPDPLLDDPDDPREEEEEELR